MSIDFYIIEHTESNRSVRRDYYSNYLRRRKTFESYAKENGFDPLVPGSWYTQSRKKIATFRVCQITSYSF
jgi:hypothetical protein